MKKQYRFCFLLLIIIFSAAFLNHHYILIPMNVYQDGSNLHAIKSRENIYYAGNASKDGIHKLTKKGKERIFSLEEKVIALTVNDNYISLSTSNGIIQMTYDGKTVRKNEEILSCQAMYADSRYLYIFQGEYADEKIEEMSSCILNAEDINKPVEISLHSEKAIPAFYTRYYKLWEDKKSISYIQNNNQGLQKKSYYTAEFLISKKDELIGQYFDQENKLIGQSDDIFYFYNNAVIEVKKGKRKKLNQYNLEKIPFWISPVKTSKIKISDDKIYTIFEAGDMPWYYPTGAGFFADAMYIQNHEMDILITQDRKTGKELSRFCTEPCEKIILVNDNYVWTLEESQIGVYDQQNEFELVKEEKIKCHLWWGTYTTEIVDGQLFLYHGNTLKEIVDLLE